MFKILMEKISRTRITFAQWIATFLAILFVRIFLENFSNIPATGYWASDFSTIIHYCLYYLAVITSVLLFLGIFIDRKMLEKVVLFALVGNILPPVLDIATSGGSGISMHYIAGDGMTILKDYFLFFTPATIQGITPGMKISFCLGFLAIFAYIFYYTRSSLRALFAAVGVYSIIFFWGS